MKLQLYYPIKPWIITQKFGETAYKTYYQQNGINFTGHNGMDIAALHGQEVYAAHDGVVSIEVDSKQGHGVIITTNELFEYKDGSAFFKTIYWHLIDNIPVKEGQLVKAGDLIGYADSTGLSTGNHLHFGLKPMNYVGGVLVNVEQNNGYYGAIDPVPYLIDKYTDSTIFTVDMHMGQSGDDVYKLQSRLKLLGYFPADVECTRFYGRITKDAVYRFQKDYVYMSWYERYILKGSICGQKTRVALNVM